MELGCALSTHSQNIDKQDKVVLRKSLVIITKQQAEINYVTCMIFLGNQEHWYHELTILLAYLERFEVIQFFQNLKVSKLYWFEGIFFVKYPPSQSKSVLSSNNYGRGFFLHIALMDEVKSPLKDLKQQRVSQISVFKPSNFASKTWLISASSMP
jgi:hypothetical protein